jgi:hypothetical protein
VREAKNRAFQLALEGRTYAAAIGSSLSHWSEFSGDPLLMAIGAVEADLRPAKKVSNALSDDISENQQSD